jgi:hypothetical protein
VADADESPLDLLEVEAFGSDLRDRDAGVVIGLDRKARGVAVAFDGWLVDVVDDEVALRNVRCTIGDGSASCIDVLLGLDVLDDDDDDDDDDDLL